MPLCRAALTFSADAKKVSKESGLTPPILSVSLGSEKVVVTLNLRSRTLRADDDAVILPAALRAVAVLHQTVAVVSSLEGEG